MAGGQERILRGRIRSVQATKKITRAMELIAASRIVKAQQRVIAAVPYSEQITEVVKDLAAAGGEVSSPLLAGRTETKVKCYVAITADRGLCGGYNSGVLRATEGEVKADILAGKDYAIVAVGRKAEAYFRFRGYKVMATFAGFSDNPTYENARQIGQNVVAAFAAGDVDSVELVYTRFISAGSQEVVRRPLVPLERETIAGGDGAPGDHSGAASYEFEPDPGTILDSLLPRYIEARVYAALLNAAASEHAFRQRAMKSATDNAEELIKTLSRIMNRARQDSITTEIMEIVSGAEALGGDSGGKHLRIIDLDESVILPNRRPGSGGGSADTLVAPVVHTIAAVAPAKAPASSATATIAADDLKQIVGIGPVIVRKLADLGYTTFRQVAAWTPEDAVRIGEQLDFKGRIEREDWIAQAKQLHAAKYGETI
jgi:F-type H+-transporting ATPase subunit gamma